MKPDLPGEVSLLLKFSFSPCTLLREGLSALLCSWPCAVDTCHLKLVSVEGGCWERFRLSLFQRATTCPEVRGMLTPVLRAAPCLDFLVQHRREGNSPAWEGVWGRTDTCARLAEALCRPPETVTVSSVAILQYKIKPLRRNPLGVGPQLQPHPHFPTAPPAGQSSRGAGFMIRGS